jgi:hypothetical protein
VAHMRFLLGVIFGVLLIVATVFIFDSLATKEDAAGAEPRQIVNWDVLAIGCMSLLSPSAGG